MSDNTSTSTPDDAGSNASGNQSTSAETYDIVDSGQSEDIENSLTGQGTSDREVISETSDDETEGHRGSRRDSGEGAGGGGARGR